MKQTYTTGILLVNLGTPTTPDVKGIRRYLAEFLSDPRVVELPAIIWQPILRGLVLTSRPRRIAPKYQSIWQKGGSPLLVISQQQVQALQQTLDTTGLSYCKVVLGMRYGQPSLQSAIDELLNAGIENLIILPLYPQYCAATTASAWDKCSQILSKKRALPAVNFIHHYHQHPLYTKAISQSIADHFNQQGTPEKLLLSYHGMPEITHQKGDPYYTQCLATSDAIEEVLKNEYHIDIECMTVFQSRFGLQRWLQPYISQTLKTLAKSGCQSVAVICPGFSADCIETLEEIAEESRDIFLTNGGKNYSYIPALNASKANIELFSAIIQQYTLNHH